MAPRPQDDADGRLVARLVALDEMAWVTLLETYGGLVASSCRRSLLRAGLRADEEAVADASAEVVRTLLADGCRLLKAHRPGTPLGAYLRVIARTRTLNALRSLAPFPLLGEAFDPEGEGAVGEALRLSERAERLGQALGTLPARDAEALRLFHLEGLDYAGISARVAVPPDQVGVLLKRAREKLRAILGEDFLESV